MGHSIQLTFSCITLAALLITLINPAPAQNKADSRPSSHTPSSQAPSSQTWTLEEALTQLRLHPQDAYLQYVALQLARRAGRLDEVLQRITGNAPAVRANGRRESIDLFSLFTGALAVQESLQLDAMRSGSPGNERGLGPMRNPPPEMRRETVPITRLRGPTIKSHSWRRLLAGRQPEISPLAHYVPEDFYFIEFRSLPKLLDAVETGDLWSAYLFNQIYREARSHNTGEALKRQLVLESGPELRQFYELAIMASI